MPALSSSASEASSVGVPPVTPVKPMPPALPHVTPKPADSSAGTRPGAPRVGGSADVNDPALNGQK
jgi:hypothetical protein